MMYNELCEYKGTEGNITLLLLLLYYLIQLCTGGAISPTSLPPGCRLLSVSPGDFQVLGIYAYVYIYMHVRVYIYLFIYIMYAHKCIYLYSICTQVCIYLYNICTQGCIYLYNRVYMYIWFWVPTMLFLVVSRV